MFYVYVLQSLIDGLLYTGYTGDLKKRISEHNEGRNFSTKTRKPFKLVYYEACFNEKDAKAREKYLKSGMGKRYVKNRLKFFFEIESGGVPR
ncbi:MAG TPA: excinuclease ABC subunit C [Candidatus Moranbacteria bacterium]|nr:excinuclease ABC subunit C [Candidatus Moranbacteria bacterium]HBI50769.1 excinuclease ABC subunit C [Candidatus Moranbacteria bacterium]HBU10840.1 excinuclease ABC subunit C [Candidatus Moranbacteria bacterium]HCO99382.1 excinuclease ABC subunit C [Candidatus Moranbacteria bacterium]